LGNVSSWSKKWIESYDYYCKNWQLGSQVVVGEILMSMVIATTKTIFLLTFLFFFVHARQDAFFVLLKDIEKGYEYWTWCFEHPWFPWFITGCLMDVFSNVFWFLWSPGYYINR